MSGADMTETQDYLDAVAAQNMAADPAATRLASANAGSGKTRVLVNRVSRILLRGVAPEKILCLTYTKAAAAEMQSRLFETLGGWSILEDAPLRAALDKMVGGPTPDIALTTARQLFAKALETPEGLKVQTIHAFCERILARFPMEAGILPGYAPLDDLEMNEIRADIRAQIYQEAMDQPQGALNKAVQRLTLAKADQTLDELFGWLSRNSDKIKDWKEAGGLAPLAQELGLEDVKIDLLSLKIKAWEATPHEALRAAAKAMCESPNANDQKKGEVLARAVTETDPLAAWGLYASIVYTQKFSAVKQVCTKNSGPEAVSFFGTSKAVTDEMQRIHDVGQAITGLQCYKITEAFFVLAQAFTARFADAKHERRGLDFNDQIFLVRDLLKNKAVSDWVRYKLDGGIEHILLDEAQDTSPAQWEIIDALADTFIQDSPDRPPHSARTLFAVGDEKQSIYSFQGAEPEAFLSKIRAYAGHDNKADIRMRMSFRSAPDILSFVDQIFVGDGARLKMFDAAEFPLASDLLTHSAHRSDRGLVEFWPAVEKPEAEEEKDPWDTTPVDAMSKADARERLAHEVAAKIKSWLDNKEPVFDRKLGATRAMRAGDILILVQSRNAFFDAVIRNIKGAGVAVAGADRLVLRDAVVVKDLLALARFALLPQDDLALAELLKSPLMGWDEETLFSMAYGRGKGSLYGAVKAGRPETAAFLDFVITQSRAFAPYEFFSKVLDFQDEDGRSLHKRIYTRLGLEAKDALEAFLARALAHQRQGSPSLQHFVHSFSQSEQDLKRVMDAAEEDGEGMVRVMTVHGAKGLEAPIVFLPDTTQIPKRPEPVISLAEGYALTGNAKQTPEIIQAHKDRAKAKKEQEYLRLFYVAMTRAESRLVICGYKHGQKKGSVSKGSWYSYARQAFEGLESAVIDTPFGDGLRYGEIPEAISGQAAAPDTLSAGLPDWIARRAPAAPRPRKTVTPSHLLASPEQGAPAQRSPLLQSKESRFERGNLIHKLLEILPDVASEHRSDMADKILRGYKVAEVEHRQIKDEVMAVLNNPDFAEIFAPGSRAEVSLAGSAAALGRGLYLNAQIDRLSVTDDKVFIVDYKSNRPPPTRQEDVADIYWGQMAAYRALAQEIYPEREIICALLWTDGPSLMILDDKELGKALTRIKRLLT